MSNSTAFKFINCFYISFLLILVINDNAFSQRKSVKDSSAVQKAIATIPNTELRTVYSKLFDQEFNIFIQLPMTYNPNSSNMYPVMYVTDANRCFPLVANISTLLGFPKTEFPEIIVVGIGYKIKGMEDWAAWRTRDLTPTNVPATDKNTQELLSALSGRDIIVKSGGATKFLDFIISELIPFIESNYHVSKTDKALAGYSYGGLFALYALFKHPEAFNRYFSGSPSISWDKGSLFQFEEEYAKSHNDLNARLFISAGSLEGKAMLENVEKMKSTLLSRNYPNFSFESHIFDNESHISCYPTAYMRAFVTLYK